MPSKYTEVERIAKFWTHVQRTDDGTCWLWTASTNKGYGQFRYDGTMRAAYRIAYELIVGRIPVGMCLCHTCDNPPCVNPSHMFLGTQADNLRDARQKGRMTVPHHRGAANNRAKLGEDDIRIIRKRLFDGEQGIAIAREFGVSNSLISDIRNRRIWIHVI